jgi:DNA-binding CsgD family transcriptional regulator
LLVAEGADNAAIARQLGLKPSTVGNYILRIQQRLRLDGRGALAAWVSERRDPSRPDAVLRRGETDPST